jgi:OmpA-OmpF porin, OOP family
MESLLASLLHSLDKESLSQIASSSGEHQDNISKGLESSLGCILGALLSRSEDPVALRRTMDLLPGNLGEISFPKMATAFSAPGYPLMQTGRDLMSGIFGTSDSTVVNAVARESGLSTSAAANLLSIAAPVALSSVSREVDKQGWTMRGLGSALQRESAAIRSALPAGVSDFLWPRDVTAAAASPVIAQSIQPDRRSGGWLGGLALAIAGLGCFWLWMHARRPIPIAATTSRGTANRLADQSAGLGDFVTRILPNGVNLKIPSDGAESRLLGVIEGSPTAGQTTGLGFDRILFDAGSANLRPDSSEQLNNVAAILKAYPNVHLRLAGYTDNVGSPEQTLELSLARATTVKDELAARGISPDRVTTEGFGDLASADDSTAAGRALNRRVSVQVTQR